MYLSKELTSDLNNIKECIPEGLDFQELIRVPRRALSSADLARETTLTESGLKDHICCVICSGIIQNCVVIKTCLHRFCSLCIEKCFRTGNKECPQCRKHVPSKRFLHHDSIFDAIITTILPNVKLLNDLNDSLTIINNKRLLLSRNPNLPNHRSFFQADLEIIFDNKSNILDSVQIINKLFYYLNGCDKCRANAVSIDPFEYDLCDCNYIRGLRAILSLLDDNRNEKEFRYERKSILLTLPLPPPSGLTHFKILPRSILYTNRTHGHLKIEFLTRTNITIRGLNNFLIAKFANTNHDPKFTLDTKYTTQEHPVPFSPFDTLAYIRNVSLVLSHDTLILYYSQ